MYRTYRARVLTVSTDVVGMQVLEERKVMNWGFVSKPRALLIILSVCLSYVDCATEGFGNVKGSQVGKTIYVKKCGAHILGMV